MKYYGKFYYNEWLFEAYVEANSLKEAIGVTLNTKYELAYIYGSEIYENDISFTNYPGKKINLKKLYLWSFSRKQRKLIRTLIKNRVIKGEIGFFKTEIDLEDFLSYCAKEAKKTFEALRLNVLIKETYAGESQNTTNSKAIGSVFDEIMQDADADEYLSDKEKTATKSDQDKREKLIAIKKKEEYLKMIKGIPAVSEVNRAYITHNGEKVKDKFGDMAWHIGNWMELFKSDFKETSIVKLLYVIINSAMHLEYKGFKIDVSHPDCVYRDRNKKWKPKVYYLTMDEKFQLEEKLPMYPLYLHSEILTMAYIFMQIPYTCVDGHFTREIWMNGERKIFTMDIEIKEYGQSIILKWDK